MTENIFDERFELNESAKTHIIYNEHIIRYEFAKEFVQDKTVLEIASGSGYGSNMFIEAGAKKVIAMDIDEFAVKKAQEKYKNNNLIFRIGDAEKIDLPDNSVDTLVSFETIEHLKNPGKFLCEAKRVLKGGGVVLISTPNIAVSKNKNPYHIFEYSYDEFKNALQKQFSFVKILNQSNSIASVIELNQERNNIYKSSESKPLFFVAVCSNEKKNLPEKNFMSLNGVALENVYNNPGLKLVNGIYSLVVKIPGMKRVLGLFR